MKPGMALLQPRGTAHCVTTFRTREDSCVYGWEAVDTKDTERIQYTLNYYSTGVGIAQARFLLIKYGMVEFYFLLKEKQYKEAIRAYKKSKGNSSLSDFLEKSYLLSHMRAFIIAGMTNFSLKNFADSNLRDGSKWPEAERQDLKRLPSL